MRLYELNTLPVFLFNNPKLYTDKEWSIIKQNKNIILQLTKNIAKKHHLDLLFFTGFYFIEHFNISILNEYISLYVQYFKDLFSPPKGNLAPSIIFIGERPGERNQHIKVESNWTFGPSSYLLHHLCFDLNIYPYFTNLFKQARNKDNKSPQFYKEILSKELNILKKYNPNVKIVCLGSYKEFNYLKEYYKIYRIWHPAYLLRVNSQQYYNKWRRCLNDILQSK